MVLEVRSVVWVALLMVGSNKCSNSAHCTYLEWLLQHVSFEIGRYQRFINKDSHYACEMICEVTYYNVMIVVDDFSYVKTFLHFSLHFIISGDSFSHEHKHGAAACLLRLRYLPFRLIIIQILLKADASNDAGAWSICRTACSAVKILCSVPQAKKW